MANPYDSIATRANGEVIDASWFNTIKSTLNDNGAVKNNISATTDPGTSNDDSENYQPGSLWINTTTDTVFVCTDESTGAAVWIEVVDLTSAQVLTGKDYDGGTASNTSRITVPKAATATLSGLTRKEATLVYDTTLKQLQVDDGTTLNAIGSGGGAGGINYLEDNNTDFETGVGDWVAYADAAGTEPVDGTGGSPTSTFTASASSPLRGTQSGLITKDAANRQGEGVSVDFTLDRQDLGKTIYVSYDFEASANYVTGDILPFIYDKDGTALGILTRDGTNTRFTGSFSADSTNDDYRLILHIATTNASAYTYKIDNVKVGPDALVPGAIISNWTTFSPSWKGTTTDPVIGDGTLNGWYRRNGDSMDVSIYLKAGSTTTFGSGTYYFEIPGGNQVDTSKVQGSVNVVSKGEAFVVDSGVAGYNFSGLVSSTNPTQIRLWSDAGTTYWSPTVPFTLANNDEVAVNITGIPISGWSSGASISTTEALNATKVSMAGKSNSTSLSTGTTTTVVFNNAVSDPYSIYNNSTGEFTVTETGKYYISSGVAYDANATGIRATVARVGGVDTINSPVWPGNSVANRVALSGVLDLTAGDVVTIAAYQDSGGSLNIGLSNASTFAHLHRLPDFSTFSVYGETEYTETSDSTFTNWPITANTWGDISSMTLTPGEWDVSGVIYTNNNGTVSFDSVFIGLAGTASGTSTTGLSEGNNIVGISNISTATSGKHYLTIPSYKIVVTTNTTVYLKGYIGTSNTNVQLTYRMSARRIK